MRWKVNKSESSIIFFLLRHWGWSCPPQEWTLSPSTVFQEVAESGWSPVNHRESRSGVIYLCLVSHGKELRFSCSLWEGHWRVLSSRHDYPANFETIARYAMWRLDQKGAKVESERPWRLLLTQMREEGSLSWDGPGRNKNEWHIQYKFWR